MKSTDENAFHLRAGLAFAHPAAGECALGSRNSKVWPSNENLRLYYRFRESHGDRARVQDRPAVMVLRPETVDLVSLVHLRMLLGWEMYLLTSPDCGRGFVSHDGYSDLARDDSVPGPSGPNDPQRRPAP